MSRNTRDDSIRGFLAINALLREELAIVRDALLRRVRERKYNPNWGLQPRAPRGVPEGGQWVQGGGAKPSMGTAPKHGRDSPVKDTRPRNTPFDELTPPQSPDDEARVARFFDPIDDNPYFWELTAHGLLPRNPTVADFFNLKYDLTSLRGREFTEIARSAGMSAADLLHNLNYGASVMSERAVNQVDAIFENPGLAGTNIVRRGAALRRYIELSGVRPEYQNRVFNEILGLAGFTPEQYEQHQRDLGIGIQFPALLGGGGPRATPAPTARLRFPIPPPSSVWRLPPVQRGRVIEAALGHNLPRDYRVIDRFSEDGVATSIKSVNLGDVTYQRAQTLDRVLRGYVDQVAGFRGARFARRVIEETEITARALDLVIPYAGTRDQQAVISAIVRYGESRGVAINVIIYP